MAAPSAGRWTGRLALLFCLCGHSLALGRAELIRAARGSSARPAARARALMSSPAAPPVPRTVASLKAELVRAGALCDRGFSARPAARERARALIEALAALNECADATAGLDGSSAPGRATPIVGLWELIYTDARDVTSLGLNPLVVVGSIYQDIRNPPEVLNLIELSPRALNAQLALDTTFRLEVGTRAIPRSPSRAGLAFLKVGGKPVSLFGSAVPAFFAPPPLELPFPFGPGGPAEAQAESGGAFFDVAFLDDEMLVIRQGAPGGYFVSLRAQGLDAE